MPSKPKPEPDTLADGMLLTTRADYEKDSLLFKVYWSQEELQRSMDREIANK